MNTVLALLALVHASHCYGPRKVDGTGFQIWSGYKPFYYQGETVKFNGILELEEGSLGHPLKECSLKLVYYYVMRDNEFMGITEKFQNIVNLYYGDKLIDKLRVGTIVTERQPEIPYGLTECVKPVVKRFNGDGIPHLIKVYYSMKSLPDCPCHYKLYERTLDSGEVNYIAQGDMVEVKTEEECETYLKVTKTRLYGPKLVDEVGFTTMDAYNEYKFSTKGVKYKGKSDLKEYSPKDVLLLPQYYVFKKSIQIIKLDVTYKRNYQTKVNLYYGEELIDQLRVSSIETTLHAKIPNGLNDCVTPVVKSVDSLGRPTLIKVYYSMARPIDECPCHYQLYERTSDSNSDRPYKPQGDLVKLYNDIECATYLKAQA